MIEARGLQKSFGAVTAVDDVSFTAPDGRITGLLGPNGAGKSTTLRMLSTILAPQGGVALIDGIDTRTDPLAARRRIGVLNHQSGLYPNLTARENIEYFAELHGLPKAERLRRTDELIAQLRMEEFATRRAKGFSQGQRIKTALARALVHRPKNLLLDEPTNGLDVMGVRNLRALLHQLRDAGHCILFSSHVMQEVAWLCEEIVVIAHGRVLASGTPEAIRERTGAAHLEDAFVSLIGDTEEVL
jgi:sodium transport system ATP-binding protein